jgi:uncharacterized protein
MADLIVAERRAVRRGFEALTLTGGEARDTYELEVPAVSRRLAPCELRADAEDGDDRLLFRGHAAVFDQPADLRFMIEYIQRGAFRKALTRSPDVRALWNHEDRLVLASAKNNTLTLTEDPRGLLAEFEAAPTTYARDLHALVKRGDVDQMSFWFTVVEDTWRDEEDGTVTRTITEIGELYDVSPVTFPAYPQTDVDVERARRTELPDDPGTPPELDAEGVTAGAEDDTDNDARGAHLADLQARARRGVTVAAARQRQNA